MNSSNYKHQLRQEMKAVRDAIPLDIRKQAASDLKGNIIKAIEGKGGVVATYYPIGSEIHPPHDLAGFDMALPIIRDKTTLAFYKWREGDDLIHGRFDIPIPKRHSTPIDRLDIILLPLLACDMHGNRLGYGAGHYDRYIASCDYKPLLMGVCYEEQIVSDFLPTEPHDIPLDLIITPKRIIHIS